jgi:8-oxo-dGTP diphosphatase
MRKADEVWARSQTEAGDGQLPLASAPYRYLCFVPSRHRIIRSMADPEAAVAIVRARAPEESILLIRRTERVGDPWSGHWSLPGGRRDPQDSDLLHTALRELEEECGIRLGRERMEAALPAASVGRLLGPRMLVAPFVFSVDRELPTVADPEEAVEALWIPVRILRDPARHAVQSVPGMPSDMQFPGIELNGVPLWGFTYKLVIGWLGEK